MPRPTTERIPEIERWMFNEHEEVQGNCDIRINIPKGLHMRLFLIKLYTGKTVSKIAEDALQNHVGLYTRPSPDTPTEADQ